MALRFNSGGSPVVEGASEPPPPPRGLVYTETVDPASRVSDSADLGRFRGYT